MSAHELVDGTRGANEYPTRGTLCLPREPHPLSADAGADDERLANERDRLRREMRRAGLL